MTETDSTNRPLQMPVDFLPYLERYRVYQMLKVPTSLFRFYISNVQFLSVPP